MLLKQMSNNVLIDRLKTYLMYVPELMAEVAIPIKWGAQP